MSNYLKYEDKILSHERIDWVGLELFLREILVDNIIKPSKKVELCRRAIDAWTGRTNDDI